MHIVAWLSPNYITRNRQKGNTYEKIDEIMSFWATEFFVWYVPNYWYEKFWFELSPNWRQSAQAQIQSFNEFNDVVKYIQSKGWETLMTLNANSYNNSVWDIVKKLVDDAIKVWVNWIIVSDLFVLDYLKSIDYKWKINVSTIFNIYNSETVKFLKENYNINRFIFPRETTLKEIQKITSEFTDTKWEAFLSWDKCIWNNWHCFTEHNTNWGTDQFKDTTSWNPHSYCQFIEKVYDPKKIINYNFKNIINSTKLSEKEKLLSLENSKIDNLKGIWEELLSNLGKIDTKYLKQKFNWFKNKSILLYDNSLSKEVDYNKNIITFIRWFEMNYIFLKDSFTEEEKEKLEWFINENKKRIDFWIEFHEKRIEEFWNEYIKRVDTLEWNRNWFEALDFFKSIPNIEALKVPSRWKELLHIKDYITWTVNSKEYAIKNFLDYDEDNNTRKFNYYNSLDNNYI